MNGSLLFSSLSASASAVDVERAGVGCLFMN
jgi:hypothetical protein